MKSRGKPGPFLVGNFAHEKGIVKVKLCYLMIAYEHIEKM